ncbi:MAG: alpha/beta hydrolase [Bacteroidetes bacterium]|nr:alpha/beta hydrolase [Bacteroidota bacterium]
MKPTYTPLFLFFVVFIYARHGMAQGYCADGTVYLTENHPVAYDDVVYKQAAAIDEWFFEVPENIRLRVYYPSDLPVGEQRPLVVLIHGGYFIAGNYQDFNAFAERFAQMGFVCATIDYRLCKRNDCLLANVFSPCNISWGYSFVPSSYVAVVDVNDGIRWLQQHASDYHINPEQVIVSGHSAGAFTALNVAFLDQDEIQEVLSGAGTPGHDYLSEPLDPVEGIQAVVPMAGASLNTEWIDAEEINDEHISVALVHGTADGVVDYDVSAAIPCCHTYQTQVYGACAVAHRVHELGGNLLLLSGEGFGHDIGDSLLLQAIFREIPAFIVKTVLCGENVSLHTTVTRSVALSYCPDGSGTAPSICDVLPSGPGLTVPVVDLQPARMEIRIAPSAIAGNNAEVIAEIPFSDNYQYVLQDQTGRICLQNRLWLPAGEQHINIEVDLPAGVYMLHLTGSKGLSGVARMLRL